MSHAHFTKATFTFLRELKENNARDWFERNKPRFRAEVQEPAIRFVTDFAPHLGRISARFRADPRPVGGSIFRIYRDTRFAKDKSPYKTHMGIQFRHEDGKDAHTPGYYLHVEPGTVFVGMGVWHPDAPSLKAIREHLVADAKGWRRVTNGARFRERFRLEGDSLVRPPAGFDAGHPLIDDLKRKDFVAVTSMSERDATKPGFLDAFTRTCRDGTPFMKWLCAALEVPF